MSDFNESRQLAALIENLQVLSLRAIVVTVATAANLIRWRFWSVTLNFMADLCIQF